MVYVSLRGGTCGYVCVRVGTCGYVWVRVVACIITSPLDLTCHVRAILPLVPLVLLSTQHHAHTWCVCVCVGVCVFVCVLSLTVV